MPKRYFVNPDGSVAGECLVEDPANPRGCDIVEISDVGLSDTDIRSWRVEDGKVRVDASESERRTHQKRYEAAQQAAAELVASDGMVAGMLGLDPAELDAYIEENINTLAEMKALLKLLAKSLWVVANR